MDILELTDKELWNEYYKYLSWADRLWDTHEKPLLMRHLYSHVIVIMNELKRRGLWNQL